MAPPLLLALLALNVLFWTVRAPVELAQTAPPLPPEVVLLRNEQPLMVSAPVSDTASVPPPPLVVALFWNELPVIVITPPTQNKRTEPPPVLL